MKKTILSVFAVLLCLTGCGKEEAPAATDAVTSVSESAIAETTVPETTAQTISVPEYTLLESPIPEQIQDIDSIALMIDGVPFYYSTDPETVEKMEEMFSGAQWLGYEPQTYYLGVELMLFSAGNAVKVELDLTDDLCRIGDKFYDYGPGMDGEDSIKALPKLWDICGFTEWTFGDFLKWPEAVLETHESYFSQFL